MSSADWHRRLDVPYYSDGVDYQLLVATYMDSSFLTSVVEVHSLDLRLYLHNPSGFAEIFSSQRFEDRQPTVPQAIEQTLRDTKLPSEQFTSRYGGCTGRSWATLANCKA